MMRTLKLLCGVLLGVALSSSAFAMGKRPHFSGQSVDGPNCRQAFLSALGENPALSGMKFEKLFRGVHPDGSACDVKISYQDSSSAGAVASVGSKSDAAMWPFNHLYVAGAPENEDPNGLERTTSWSCERNDQGFLLETAWVQTSGWHDHLSAHLAFERQADGSAIIQYTDEDYAFECRAAEVSSTPSR